MSIQCVTRNEDDTRWRLALLANNELRSEEFDKVVFCHGYQTNAEMPEFSG